MWVLLICDSLEPEKDGVGDYTRVLGRALVEAGHTVRLLAIHDRHIATAGYQGECNTGWVGD